MAGEKFAGWQEAAMKDYRLKVTISNNRLLERIERQGFGSITAFCRAHDLSLVGVYNCVALRSPLLKKNGQFRNLWVRLAEALNCEVPDLIPEAHWERVLPRRTAQMTFDHADVEALLPPKMEMLPDEARFSTELRHQLATWLAKLPDRDMQVVFGRYGIGCEEKTYEELGQEMGVNRERVRQIELRALRSLSARARRAFPDVPFDGPMPWQKGAKQDVLENLAAR
jgi:RNA polymerase sigma factor (sigma-70 family)